MNFPRGISVAENPYTLRAVEQQKHTDQSELAIKIEPTRSSCAGSAAAFLLRSIAASAGAYAPGIEERMFNELERRAIRIEEIELWFASYSEQLSQLGYRYLMRRVAFDTQGIVNWVEGGKGCRGAILPTNVEMLHPEGNETGQHAVALMTNGAKKRGSNVIMIDPWPDSPRAPVPATLDNARRDAKWAGLLFYWSGYS